VEVKAVRLLWASILICSWLVVPSSGLAKDAETVVDELNRNSFRSFNAALSKPALLERIYENRVVAPRVREAFESDFANSIQGMFTGSFGPSKTEIIGKVILFATEADRGRAVVRFALSGYRYNYFGFELARDQRGKLSILDWVDYDTGERFSDAAGNALVMAMPNRPAVESLITSVRLTEAQAFQVGELCKAIRDNKVDRYFQILDGLEEQLRQDPRVVLWTVEMARLGKDRGRFDTAVEALLALGPDDVPQSFMLATYYIGSGRFEDAIQELDRFSTAIGVTDGVVPSFQATAATALGDNERAQAFALEATTTEPTLELSWWSLLRARTAAGNFAGATEALTRLEDDFGHSLTPQVLRRDRFLAILADQPEYEAWRAGR